MPPIVNRMVDFHLQTLPPGLIDHKEWTAENGRNNALRINGLGAPRAFRTHILRRIGFPNTSYGEDYDARIAPIFEDTDKLPEAELNSEFSGEVLPTDGAEIYLRPDLTLKPVKAYVWENVEGATADQYGKVVVKREYKHGEEMTIHKGENLVVDFGQNCAAVPSFEFCAKEGTKLTCTHRSAQGS